MDDLHSTLGLYRRMWRWTAKRLEGLTWTLFWLSVLGFMGLAGLVAHQLWLESRLEQHIKEGDREKLMEVPSKRPTRDAAGCCPFQ